MLGGNINSPLSWPFVHVPIYSILVIVAALTLGGGTRDGFLGDAIVQLLALPLLVYSLVKLLTSQTSSPPWFELTLALLIALVPLLQLIPLSPDLWAHLASKDIWLDTFKLFNLPPSPHPISVTPEATALGALSLIPPLAVFFGLRGLSNSQRRIVVVVVLFVAAFSVFLGLLQVAEGEKSRLRFFEITNPTEAVGFFANRNHFAAFLYLSFVLASAWTIDSLLELTQSRNHRHLEPQQIITFAVGITLMFLLASTQIIARSRAGLALTLLGLGGIALVTLADPRNKSRKTILQIIGASAFVVLLFTAQFGFERVVDRLHFDPLNDTRIIVANTTIAATKTYFPFGSGIGTFRSIYELNETRADLIPNTFINHAHDDLLQLALEGGLLALIALGAFFVWFGACAFKVWRPGLELRPLDVLLARCATLGIALLMLHSLVDYPLRTCAGMVLLAICCALLTTPGAEPKSQYDSQPHKPPRLRH